MIRKNDWEAAAEAHMAERRSALGPPPAPEEVLAFFNGSLTPTEAERVRELLICYPELARIATAPFPLPEEDADEMLSDAQLAHDWSAIQSRVQTREPQFWRAMAIAAGIVAAVLSVLLFRAETNERRQSRALQWPRPNVESHLLLPDGHRGGAAESAVELPPQAGDFLLVASLINVEVHSDYRVEIVSSRTPGRALWSAAGVQRRADDTLTVLVPQNFLAPGVYTLAVDGLDGARVVHLAKYSFRVPPPPNEQ